MRSDKAAAVDTGDDRVIVRVVANWRSSTPEVLQSAAGSPACGHVWRAKDGAWTLAFAVQRGHLRQRHFVVVAADVHRDDRWSLMKLGAGVWEVSPSVHFAGQIHAFVTIVGVPDPAPWEGDGKK